MATNYNLYVGKVEWYSDYDEKEKTSYCIIPADNFSGAMDQIVEDWGEDCLINVSITPIGEDCGSVNISESMADALIHDIPEDVYCVPSEWRRKQDGKGSN